MLYHMSTRKPRKSQISKLLRAATYACEPAPIYIVITNNKVGPGETGAKGATAKIVKKLKNFVLHVYCWILYKIWRHKGPADA